MVSQIIPYVTQVFVFCMNMFWNLIGAIGSRRIWLYAMYMYLSYRFFLRPIFGWVGPSGSDKVKKNRKDG